MSNTVTINSKMPIREVMTLARNEGPLQSEAMRFIVDLDERMTQIFSREQGELERLQERMLVLDRLLSPEMPEIDAHTAEELIALQSSDSTLLAVANAATETRSDLLSKKHILPSFYQGGLQLGAALKLATVNSKYYEASKPYFRALADLFGLIDDSIEMMMKQLGKESNFLNSYIPKSKFAGRIIKELSFAEIVQLKKDVDLLSVTVQVAFLLRIPSFKKVETARTFLNHPENQDELALITSLLLPNRRLSFLPTEIGRLVGLQELQLSSNPLKTLPPEIGNLVELKRLWARGTQIKQLPDEIGNLRSLEVLELSHNKLEKLPSTIGNLTNLTTLTLHENEMLVSLPDTMGNLLSLSDLFLSHAQEAALNPSIRNRLGTTIKII